MEIQVTHHVEDNNTSKLQKINIRKLGCGEETLDNQLTVFYGHFTSGCPFIISGSCLQVQKLIQI